MQFYATCTRQPARGYLPGCTRAVHTLHVRDLVQFCQTLKTGLLGKQNRKRTTKIEEENRNDKEKPFLELVAYCRFSPGISRPEARIQPICCLSMDYSYTVSSLCSRHENGQLSFLNLYKIRYRAKFQFFFFRLSRAAPYILVRSKNQSSQQTLFEARLLIPGRKASSKLQQIKRQENYGEMSTTNIDRSLGKFFLHVINLGYLNFEVCLEYMRWV